MLHIFRCDRYTTFVLHIVLYVEIFSRPTYWFDLEWHWTDFKDLTRLLLIRYCYLTLWGYASHFSLWSSGTPLSYYTSYFMWKYLLLTGFGDRWRGSWMETSFTSCLIIEHLYKTWRTAISCGNSLVRALSTVNKTSSSISPPIHSRGQQGPLATNLLQLSLFTVAISVHTKLRFLHFKLFRK